MDYLPFSQVVAEIRRLSQLGATGTMFIATADNRSAQLILEKGEIIYLFFHNKRGQEAIEPISRITDARFRFQEGGALPRPMALPRTPALLAMFAGDPVAPPAPDGKPPGPVSAAALSEAQKSALERCLAECIGPMAALLCEEHLKKARTLAEAIDALAQELPSPAQEQKFRDSVAARLG